MKKFIALICAVCILMTSAYALEPQFDQKYANPMLSLPASGIPHTEQGSVCIQAEDCTMSKNATVIEDETASGKMAVKFTPP